MFSLTSQFRSSCLYLSITDLLLQLTSEFFSWASHFSLFLNVFNWLRNLETQHLPAVCICQSQTSWCNLLLNFFLGRPTFLFFSMVFDWLRNLETQHLCTVQILKVAGAPNLYSRVGKPHYEICGYYCCDGSDN